MLEKFREIAGGKITRCSASREVAADDRCVWSAIEVAQQRRRTWVGRHAAADDRDGAGFRDEIEKPWPFDDIRVTEPYSAEPGGELRAHGRFDLQHIVANRNPEATEDIGEITDGGVDSEQIR